METAHYSRQLDLLTPEQSSRSVTIIGAGGIGSPTAFILAKMGVANLTVYDFDDIEIENVPSQLYKLDQVGMKKVDALAQNIKDFADVDITPTPTLWDGGVGQIVISAVDSMKVRKEIFDTLKNRPEVELYIEARMSAEEWRIYALKPADPDQQAFYEANLYSDDEASEEVCTAKAIAFNTFVIGGMIGSLVKRFLRDENIPAEMIGDLRTHAFYRGKDV